MPIRETIRDQLLNLLKSTLVYMCTSTSLAQNLMQLYGITLPPQMLRCIITPSHQLSKLCKQVRLCRDHALN